MPNQAQAIAPAPIEPSAVQVQFRASAELVDRLDDHADRLRVRARGCAISRSDAIRSLLEDAIAREEEAEAAACAREENA